MKLTPKQKRGIIAYTLMVITYPFVVFMCILFFSIFPCLGLPIALLKAILSWAEDDPTRKLYYKEEMKDALSMSAAPFTLYYYEVKAFVDGEH